MSHRYTVIFEQVARTADFAVRVFSVTIMSTVL